MTIWCPLQVGLTCEQQRKKKKRFRNTLFLDPALYCVTLGFITEWICQVCNASLTKSLQLAYYWDKIKLVHSSEKTHDSCLPWVLFFFFLKNILLRQASFCFQCICQIQNVNNHLIALDACFKVPHIFLLHDCLFPVVFFFFFFKIVARNFLFSKLEKKNLPENCPPTPFRSLSKKRQKEAFFVKI